MAAAKTPKKPRGKGSAVRIGAKPVANDGDREVSTRLRRMLAPWAQIDRYPVVLGSRLTIAYYASTLRICQNGYRQQFVDVLDELLEKDGHAQCVLGQRVLAANGQIELVPPTPKDPEDEQRIRRAQEIRDDLQRRVDAIPARTQAISTLLFASLYYGIGASELHWERRADGWWIVDIAFIHSRRIAYPDQNDWSAHIWDQGSVTPLQWGIYPTERFFGLRVEDYPGKFLFHKPSFRADYPTRDGLGRVMGWWMCIKLIGARGFGEFVERFGKPWATATYTTAEGDSKIPRAATETDIKAADEAVAAMGAGSDCGITLPDSVTVKLMGPGVNGTSAPVTHNDLINACNAELSKVVRGGTLNTDAGEKGARSLGEVHAEGDIKNARFDAGCLADTLKSQLIWWLCHLNYPGEEDLCPEVKVHVEQITPEEILERATKLAADGAPVDARWLAAKLGVQLADLGDPNALRLAPVKPTDLFALLPAASKDIAGTVSALAAMVGVKLTPAIQTSLSEMDPTDVARLLQSLLGAAKANEKAAAETGANEEAAPGSDDEPAEGAPEPRSATPPSKGDAEPEKSAVPEKKPGAPATKKGAPRGPAAGAAPRTKKKGPSEADPDT